MAADEIRNLANEAVDATQAVANAVVDVGEEGLKDALALAHAAVDAAQALARSIEKAAVGE